MTLGLLSPADPEVAGRVAAALAAALFDRGRPAGEELDRRAQVPRAGAAEGLVRLRVGGERDVALRESATTVGGLPEAVEAAVVLGRAREEAVHAVEAGVRAQPLGAMAGGGAAQPLVDAVVLRRGEPGDGTVEPQQGAQRVPAFALEPRERGAIRLLQRLQHGPDHGRAVLPPQVFESGLEELAPEVGTGGRPPQRGGKVAHPRMIAKRA